MNGNRRSEALFIFFGLVILVAVVVSRPRKSYVRIHISRQEIVGHFFAKSNGAHAELERKIKDSLPNPGSYEHLETRFKDKLKTVYVFTKFRAKNASDNIVVDSVEGTLEGSGGRLINWRLIR